jgi:hypothetical protein
MTNIFPSAFLNGTLVIQRAVLTVFPFDQEVISMYICVPEKEKKIFWGLRGFGQLLP